jgi:hypothetical protein
MAVCTQPSAASFLNEQWTPFDQPFLSPVAFGPLRFAADALDTTNA